MVNIQIVGRDVRQLMKEPDPYKALGPNGISPYELQEYPSLRQGNCIKPQASITDKRGL